MPQRNEFEDFYQASYGRVVALLLAVLGNRQEAEDAAQEAFTRALARWPRLSTYEVPEAWVRQVALRLAVDSGRRCSSAGRTPRRTAGSRGSVPDSGCLTPPRPAPTCSLPASWFLPRSESAG